jgi:hypothetical protein
VLWSMEGSLIRVDFGFLGEYGILNGWVGVRGYEMSA